MLPKPLNFESLPSAWVKGNVGMRSLLWGFLGDRQDAACLGVPNGCSDSAHLLSTHHMMGTVLGAG